VTSIFWTFNLPEFLRLVPARGRLAVDIGCGEGRLGRVLTRFGHRVVGIDASLISVRAAATHPEGHPVVVAGSPYVNFLHLRGRLLGR
jgi:2-polyprenyl-3-methyl-5-hydroxy-6-metoxy-1,4-benzoquinol methylase